MEGNNSDCQEQLQDNDIEQSDKHNNDKHNNDNQNINEKSRIHVDQALLSENRPSTSKKGTRKSEWMLRFKERTKTIGDELSRKRQHLQQEKAFYNESFIKSNEKKVNIALQNMRSKTATSEQRVPRQNDIVPSVSTDLNPLRNCSKKQLAGLVEGLQQLVLQLTINDRTLKNRVNRLARNISGLKDFPIFNTRAFAFTESRERIDSNLEHGEVVKKNIKEKAPKLTPAEILADYINTALKEYLGDHQEEKLEKYKCLPLLTDEYLETYALSLADAGFGCIVEASIRVNRKNNHQAFIQLSSDRETTERDAIFTLPVARRYAFEGDIVRAFVFYTENSANIGACSSVLSQSEKSASHITEGSFDNSMSSTDDDELFQDCENETAESKFEDTTEFIDTSVVISESRRAFVIKILKQAELREIVGTISFAKATKLESKLYYNLRPYDMRVPMVYIPKEYCKKEVESAKVEAICGMLYVAIILETDINGRCIGKLLQPVGKVNNLQAEVKAILLHNGLKDVKPYEQKFNDMYEGPMPPVAEEDLKYREDLRKKCIFTIDPLTARDLDDAVSVEKLGEKEYEIGVHISDVSYYLTENSELDNLVKHRATSIYLVNEVIHMLPPSLCFKCSLLPGEDKFAFSVFWKWHTDREEISSPRFTRSIINSCSQFAYEHAQKIIDNPKEVFDKNDFPDIFNEWTPNDIKWRILLLHHIAQKLKAQRYENGALSINNPKLRFQLDPLTGEPLEYEVEGRQEANFLIEEFMLLANQAVAKFIHDRFPDISILRNHAPPLQKSIKALKERLNHLGMEFNITSSKAINESMQRLSCQASDPKAVEACLNILLTKPMARAKYYCSEGKTADADFLHYALSIPIYTHFTSPIRRYPDILVHRLLAAALNYCPPPQRSTDELHCIVKICNDQKLNAKSAGDDSIELFFKRYVKAKESITLKAAVTDINNHMLKVVTLETGHAIQISYKQQKYIWDISNVPSFVLVSEKNSEMPPLKLQLFSTVNINLVLKDGKLRGFIALTDCKHGRSER